MVPVIIKTFVVIVEAGNDTECETAMKQCTLAGGLRVDLLFYMFVPSTDIEPGFFADSCSVSCGRK